ncbi:PLP-dependent aminotransferase family protein [Candidatus Cryosericum septentrionale]|jgi:2-aminoadipate transaminase|uniref:PLP-dependent aminotransferase family protein n=1 Tax=Candidatus Cryosericum septentrionale TaxID=2290913 RepID=A0A398DXU4_9BACT|nr:PLP-dependent aminotransferase family protein [Candidatus Cryosericum septentrionale]RIE16988.1 PLP-dependent aminotransferase family protein [Candidatus Cryosericum septentrionale]
MSLNAEELFSERALSFRPSEIRELLKFVDSPEIISLAGGMPDGRFFPIDRVIEASTFALREYGKKALQYGSTEGIKKLRVLLMDRMENEGVKGIDLDNVIVSTASQQGLSLVAQVFVNPGDTVIVEEPSYLGAIQAFASMQAKFCTVPLDKDGMQMDILEDRLKELQKAHIRPKFVYTVPNFHNPAGVTMTLERRKKLIELAHTYDLLIIEDDPYGEIRFEGEPIPSLLALGGKDRVVALRTFSKISFPGLRLGWIVAREDIMSKIIVGKQAADLCSPAMTQYIAYEFVSRGWLDDYVNVVRREYPKKKNAMISALEQYFPVGSSWTDPQGGLFVWVKAPESIDTAAMFREAINAKVAYVVGIAFYPHRDDNCHMRLNFSAVDPEHITEGVHRLGDLLKSKI